MGQGNSIKAFYEIHSYDFEQQLSEKIKIEIESKGKEYILGVDEEEYKKYLINKFTLEPLSVDSKSETIDEPHISKELVVNSFFQEKYQVDVYNFTISYHFSGSSILFQIQPSSCSVTTTDIYINEQTNSVSFSFKLHKKDPEEFNRAKKDYYSRAFTNIGNTNAFAKDWNNSLSKTVDLYFHAQKSKYQQENDFFTAINVKINKDTTSLFPAPTIKKKVIPQPTVSKNKEISSEPWLAKDIYDDILKIIYELGKSMEKKPATYKKKDEEGLRDQFLLFLETRYESTTATGETFNLDGKTDIILKYSKDNSNLFVAELKIWHGEAEFLKAISQLFDKYLTWRDSKVALILFVRNKEFTNVIHTIKTSIKTHPYYIKDNGNRGESSFSFIFHLQQDNNKFVYFEVIAFHFDK